MIAVWRALPAVLLELVLGLHAAVGDVLSHVRQGCRRRGTFTHVA